jgi:hypothetical protein
MGSLSLNRLALVLCSISIKHLIKSEIAHKISAHIKEKINIGIAHNKERVENIEGRKECPPQSISAGKRTPSAIIIKASICNDTVIVCKAVYRLFMEHPLGTPMLIIAPTY